jgi:hypothetical protein
MSGVWEATSYASLSPAVIEKSLISIESLAVSPSDVNIKVLSVSLQKLPVLPQATIA